MNNKKNTKRALVASVLSLVLCMTMLIGTTFAWFTDSVTSTNNKIQSGTLKVDLELLDKATGSWKSIKDSKEAIFDYDKWEPGYTDVKILKIENEGTLALKWVAKIVSETELTALANVIDVYVNTTISEYPIERDDLTGWTKAGTVAQFVNSVEETTFGTLEATESAYLGIALKMQESAGNEYQDMSLGGAFDIRILATQYTSEYDSFDNQYDFQAWDDVTGEIQPDANGVVDIYTAEQLAAIGTTAGIKVVNIRADIDLAGRLWTPIKVNNSAYSTLTINGNGYTIDNMTIVESVKGTTSTTYGTGFIGNAYAGSVEISDLTFANAQVTGKGDYVGVVVGYAYYASIVLDNVDVVNGYVTSSQWNAKSIGGLIGNKHMIDGSGQATADGFNLIECDVVDSQIIGYSMTAGLVGALPYCDKKTDDTFQDCSISGTHVVSYYNLPMDLLAVNTELPVSDDDFTVTDSIVAPRIGSSNASTNNEQFKNSVQKYDVVYLGKDYTFDLKGNQRDGVTLIGMGNTKLKNTTDYASNGTLGAIWKKMNFENLIIQDKVYTMANGVESVFKNCIFENGFRQGYSSGTGVVFDGCTFYANSEGFAMHFAEVKTKVTVKNCNFEQGTIAFGNGSGTTYASAVVEFEDCTFSGVTTRTEYFDAWASCTLTDCTFASETEIWLRQPENGEVVTLVRTTGATVVEK